MKYLIEKSNYYEIGDIVFLEYWYNKMVTPVIIKEKQGRTYLVSHNVKESKIKNAPDEKIKAAKIISKA